MSVRNSTRSSTRAGQPVDCWTTSQALLLIFNIPEFIFRSLYLRFLWELVLHFVLVSFFGVYIKFKLVLNVMYFCESLYFPILWKRFHFTVFKTQVKFVVFVNPLLGLPLFLLLVSFDELNTNLSYPRRETQLKNYLHQDPLWTCVWSASVHPRKGISNRPKCRLHLSPAWWARALESPWAKDCLWEQGQQGCAIHHGRRLMNPATPELCRTWGQLHR